MPNLIEIFLCLKFMDITLFMCNLIIRTYIVCYRICSFFPYCAMTRLEGEIVSLVTPNCFAYKMESLCVI